MNKLQLATVCLGDYSGCQMFFLDLDEWLIDLGAKVELVYSPIADIKEYPKEVDIVLVEGVVANEDNLELLKKVRDRSKILISFGDCAVTYNVTSSEPEILAAVWGRVLPVHNYVEVDVYLPGCPPNVNHIRGALEMLLNEEISHLSGKLIQLD